MSVGEWAKIGTTQRLGGHKMSSMDMTGECQRCHVTTADYIITAEMIYSLCDACFYVDVVQLAQSAA